MISAISSLNTKGVSFSANPAKGLKEGAKTAENVAERASRKVPKGLTPGKNSGRAISFDEACETLAGASIAFLSTFGSIV